MDVRIKKKPLFRNKELTGFSKTGYNYHKCKLFVTVQYAISRKVFLHYNAKILGSIGAKSHTYAICVHREACNYEGTE